MKKSIRTECTVEVDQVFVVRRSGRSVEGWCAHCAAVSTLLTPEDAAILFGVSARTIYRWMEVGRVHWTEATCELLLVCLDSLLEQTYQNVHT
jgi:hypothetical protein